MERARTATSAVTLPDQTKTPKLPQVMTAVGSCVCCLAIGATLGYTSPAFSSMVRDKETLFLRGLSPEDMAWIGSLAPLGAFVGSVFGSPVVEFLGRRKALLYVSAPAFLASWLLVGFARWLYMIHAGRFLGGLMIGLSFLACPVYITETATTGLRGTFGSFPQLVLVTGILLVYTAGLWLEWRLLALVMGIPVAGLQATVMYFMPESPTWLVHNGRRNEARRALVWLRGPDYNVDQELAFIDQSLAHRDDDSGGLLAMQQNCYCGDDEDSRLPAKRKRRGVQVKELKHPNTLIPLSIAMLLMLVQQLSGINAVIFYSVSIFRNASSTLDSRTSAVVIAAIMCLATGAASLAADRVGRRPLLILSSVLMALSLAPVSGYFFFEARAREAGLDWIPLVGLSVFLVAFSLGYGPLPWLLSAEMLPPKLKAVTASVSFGFNWLLVFAVTRSFPPLLAALGAGTMFLAFAVICAMGFVATVAFVPETKHKDLPQIQEFFRHRCGCCF